MKIKYSIILFFLAILAVGFFNACKKDDAVEANPYDDVNYNADTTTPATVDPYSITGLHKNIFSSKCNNPGCHDGTFEPDFRTVQSAYSTLVYQPVNKYTVNNIDSFRYRVIPFDKQHSFIHERITTPTTEYMPSNGTRLTQIEIDQIDKWIMDGAKNADGAVAIAPNQLPTVAGYVAFDSAFVRMDSIRYQGLGYNPFVVPQGKTVYFYFVVQDDSTLTEDLINNKVKFSLNELDFSAATSVNATYVNFPPYKFWTLSVNSSQWSVGSTVHFRYYCSDGDHTADMEFPTNQSYFVYRSIYAMKIQ